MNLLSLDALLLFVLAIPVVMRYRLLPVEGTPYWLFGILFFILLANVIVSLYQSVLKKFFNILKVKTIFLLLTVLIVVGGTMSTAIVDRSKTAPVYGVHDIILQQEAAMRFLLEGKNPYKETYFLTPLGDWHYAELGKDAVNPALYHFVMPPWYLLFPFPFYFVSIPLFGFFDGRIPLLFCFIGLLFILYQWFKDKHIALIALALTALSPAVIDYFIEGRSDIFALFWFVWSLYLLDKKKLILSSVIFGLAILSKQTIWFALPFYFIYAWVTLKRSNKIIVRLIIPFLITIVILTVPFLLWNTRAFLESVVFYLSGNSPNSYPVSGYGLGMLLYEFGVIKDIHAYYPFILWQVILGLPVLVFGLWWLVKKPNFSRLLIAYGAMLMIVWYVSRYFNNSHLGYLSSIFVLGMLKDLDEKGTT